MKTSRKPIHDRPQEWLAASLLLVLCGRAWGADLDPQRIGQWPGSPEGSAHSLADVAVSGNYAYLAEREFGLQVIDISNPAEPKQVGAVTEFSPYAVAASGHCACLLGEWRENGDQRSGLHVIDISNPASPQMVGRLEGMSGGLGLAVSGQYAFVAGLFGLRVLDISSPASPQQVGQLVDVVGHLALSGHYLYLLDGGSGSFQVIDSSDPANPRRISGMPVSIGEAWWGELAVAGKYAYITGGVYDQAARVYRDGLQVIDVSDPATPQRIGGCDTSGPGSGVVVSGNRAFMHAPKHSGVVIDITDPAHPQQVGRYRTTGYITGTAVSGNYLCLPTASGQDLAWGEGLLVFDISVLANPQRVGKCRTSGDIYRLAVSENYACVAEFPPGPDASGRPSQVIDISNPSFPQPLGQWSSSGYINDLAVSGGYAYAAFEARYDAGQYVDGGLQIIDIRNPSAPVEICRYNPNRSVSAVALSGRYAYLGASGPEPGLQVIDISDPVNPQRVGHLEGGPDYVAVSGSYAYVVGSWLEGTNWSGYGLQVIDIADPSNPRATGAYATSVDEWDFVNGLVVSGKCAYVATYRGLKVIDVSDPSHPKPVGACGDCCAAVAVCGRYAYVSWFTLGGANAVEVLDINDPANPQRVRGNSMCPANQLAVAGNLVFAATNEGLVILNTYQPPPRIESAEFGDDGFRLVFRGEAGRTIRLQRSPDLKTWEDWVILTATGDSQVVADPSAESHPCQFYRAVGE